MPRPRDGPAVTRPELASAGIDVGTPNDDPESLGASAPVVGYLSFLAHPASNDIRPAHLRTRGQRRGCPPIGGQDGPAPGRNLYPGAASLRVWPPSFSCPGCVWPSPTPRRVMSWIRSPRASLAGSRFRAAGAASWALRRMSAAPGPADPDHHERLLGGIPHPGDRHRDLDLRRRRPGAEERASLRQ